MALVYRKSTKSVARKYERSPGMEPNTGGVTHMTVINPGRPPRSNPFQWIRGSARGNHKHLSPAYRTVRGARGWAKTHVPESAHAKLVAIDEYGTIMARPMSLKQVLRNTGRQSMAYNLKALRRAMRKNMSPADRAAVKAAARGIDTGSGAKRKSSSKKSSGTTVSGGKVTAKAATKAAKSATTQAKVATKAATRAKKTTSKKVASQAAKVAGKAATKAKKAATKATSKAAKAKPSSKKAANKAAAKARRAASKAASAASAAVSASKKAQRRGRLSRKHGKFTLTSKAHGRYKRVKGFSASPFRTGRLFNPPYIHVTSKHPKRRAAGIRMAANMLGRISQRKGLPHGQRVQLVEFGPRSKRKGYAVYVPGHVSERAYVRKFHFGGAASDAHSRAMRSGYSKKRYSKKRVSANGRSRMRRNSKRHSRKHVSRNKRHSRKHGMKRNRYVLTRNRRRGLRRNFSILGIDPITQVAIPGAYAVGGLMVANAAANAAGAMSAITNVLDAGRVDPIVTKSLVGAGVAGLVLALAGKGKLPAMLQKNITPIVAGMGCAVAVRLLRGTPAAPYLGRWGAGFGEYIDQPLGAYVQDPSMGEYVDQPLGEYVDQPLGGLGQVQTMYAAAGMGDQDAADDLLDGAEASAGVGVFQAAAGMGEVDRRQMMYAAAGLGAGELMYAAAGLGEGGTTGVVGGPIGLPTFTPPVGPGGHQQPPFVSMETPIDQARLVTGVMDRTRPVKTSMVTSEGRTGEGGIFSRSIFGGSMG